MSVREFEPPSAKLVSRRPQTQTREANRTPPRSPFGGGQVVASAGDEPPRFSRLRRIYEVVFKGSPRRLTDIERTAHVEVVKRGDDLARECRDSHPALADYAERCANASRNVLAESRSENWFG